MVNKRMAAPHGARPAQHHLRRTGRPHATRDPRAPRRRRRHGDRAGRTVRHVPAGHLQAPGGARTRRDGRQEPRRAAQVLPHHGDAAEERQRLAGRVPPPLGGQPRPARRLPHEDPGPGPTHTGEEVMSTATHRATVTTEGADIVITREFSAPADLVYDAMTTPEHVRQWWGAGHGTMTTCE